MSLTEGEMGTRLYMNKNTANLPVPLPLEPGSIGHDWSASYPWQSLL